MTATGPGRPRLALDLLPETFAVCRLPPDTPVPEWVPAAGSFLTITRTAAELSLTVEEQAVPLEVRCERGYRALRVRGPLSPTLIGVLLALAEPLAAAEISIFAISTFDTDYLLVKAGALPQALEALARAGHEVPRGL